MNHMLRWTVMAIGLMLIGVLSFWLRREEPTIEPLVHSARVAADLQRCAECHAEIHQDWQAAPHSQTLRPASDEEVRARFRDQSVELADADFHFRDNGELILTSDRHPASLPVDWIFGSGHHALTPVSLGRNAAGQTELFQLNASWFPGHGLGVTPGSEMSAEFPSLGLHHTAAEALQCFACHSSYVPAPDHRIDFDNLIAGVGCTRCHIGTAAHVAADGAVPTNVNWPKLSPLDSISRCGECHRRPDEFSADELTTTNSLIIRFAPVGLSQSPCFQQSPPHGQRLDCMTCHDPHRPAVQDPQHYVDRCLSCHNSQPQGAHDCAVQPMTSHCLPCHMPKVKTLDYLSFTDHWIRVRRGGAAESAAPASTNAEMK